MYHEFLGSISGQTNDQKGGKSSMCEIGRDVTLVMCDLSKNDHILPMTLYNPPPPVIHTTLFMEGKTRQPPKGAAL